MFQASKTFAASILAMAYIGGCANTTSQGPLNSLSSMDNSRNVLSFADTDGQPQARACKILFKRMPQLILAIQTGFSLIVKDDLSESIQRF